MIIVTGASKGLGKAICERLIYKKYDVLGIARNIELLNFPALPCDISSYNEIKKLTQILKKEKVHVQGLINVAGIASMNLAVLTPSKKTQEIISTNLLGTIYLSQLISPLMIRNKQGLIINFSTIAVKLGLKGESIYAASKAGVEVFTRTFAREMSDFNINVNCIAPGPIETDLIKGISNLQKENIINQQIITKKFTKDHVCDLVEILLDERSKSLTGQIFHVGGA
jgi:3-oxoacyl-[acyl-carrier protein] reductase